MKNIEIIVDVTGSCNVEEINSQLKKIKDELSGQVINANVSFWTDEELLNKKLQELELPLKNEEMRAFMGGGNDFTGAVKNKLSNNPDMVVFIGDLGHQSLEYNTFKSNPNTQLVVIQTSYEKKINKDYAVYFIKDIKNTIKTAISDVETYTSLEDILNPKAQVQNKIEQLRGAINQNDTDSKLKP